MRQRLISALIISIIAIPFLILGNIPFLIFVTTLGNMALYEFLNFRKKLPLIIKILSHFLVCFIIVSNSFNINLELIMMLSILIILGSLVFLNDKYHYKEAFFIIGLSFVIGILFRNFIIIRNKSIYELIYLLLITIGSDTFALLIGKKLGKHKLAPTISPNKTIEGLIGGVLVGTIAGSIFYFLFVKDFDSIIIMVFISFILSLIGELGDLVKSTIKRNENVKDFSNLIPGHGGIVDRLDSILFVMLTYIIIMNFIN